MYDRFNINNKHLSFCIHSYSSFKLLSREILFINRKDKIETTIETIKKWAIF